MSWTEMHTYVVLTLAFATLLPFLVGFRIGGSLILLGFLAIVIFFGGFTVVQYWNSFIALADDLIFAAWLAIVMIAGIFVNVLQKNYLSGKRLFDIERDLLLFPILFSLVMFYPTWAISASAPRNVFVFYAAFLNGYFWENIVANIKQPQSPSPPSG